MQNFYDIVELVSMIIFGAMFTIAGLAVIFSDEITNWQQKRKKKKAQ